MPERSRHCEEEQSCTEQSDTVTEEDALGRRSRAMMPSQENCLFCATRKELRMHAFLAHTSVFPQTHERWVGEPVTVSNDTAAFLVWEAAFLLLQGKDLLPTQCVDDNEKFKEEMQQ